MTSENLEQVLIVAAGALITLWLGALLLYWTVREYRRSTPRPGEDSTGGVGAPVEKGDTPRSTRPRA